MDLEKAVRTLGYSHRHSTWEDALEELATGWPSKEGLAKDWLLIYDNACVNVVPFLPKGQHGSILVNSQSRARAMLVSRENHLQLEELSEKEAQAVFFKAIHQPKPSQADILAAGELFKKTGKLPLYVAATAIYWYGLSPAMDEEPHLSTSDEFLELFKGNSIDMESIVAVLPSQRDDYDQKQVTSN
jgi:hypothetical protein